MSHGWAQPGRAVLQRALASLAGAIEAKDRYTMGHSHRVRGYAQAMARRLCLPRALVAEIGIGAALHDIGKIGVPDELLRRTGPLSAEERRRVLEHTVIGERILAPLMGARPTVLAVVRWHHEQVDGSGRPDGLRGEEIPLAARIVAVADAFDAMTSSRPYRGPRVAAAALQELLRCVGTQFDRRCVAALLWIVRRPVRRVWPRRPPGRKAEAGWRLPTAPGAGRPRMPSMGHGTAREPRAPPYAARPIGRTAGRFRVSP